MSEEQEYVTGIYPDPTYEELRSYDRIDTFVRAVRAFRKAYEDQAEFYLRADLAPADL
jgi:hypothetical protein